jgi:hypothetical protein
MGSSVEIRALNSSGVAAYVLPDRLGGHLNTEFSDSGGGELKYPKLGLNSAQLVDSVILQTLIDGVEDKDARCDVEQLKPDQGVSDLGAITTYNGRTLVGMLAKVIVYPQNWPNPVPNGRSFTLAAPGTIIQVLMGEARTRNAKWAKVIKTDTFSGANDSAGHPWVAANKISQTFATGATYLQVLQFMYDRGLVEFEMDGDQLKVYNPGTSYRDWTLTTWRSKWWNKSSGNFDVLDETVDPALTVLSSTIDITNQQVSGTGNYLISVHEANVKVTTGGNYTFNLTYDDAVRVIVNGVMVFDDWITGSQRSADQTVALLPGINSVRVEHFCTTSASASWPAAWTLEDRTSSSRQPTRLWSSAEAPTSRSRAANTTPATPRTSPW